MSPTARPVIADGVRRRPGWRSAVAEGLYHSGALRVLQAVSRHYEFGSNDGPLPVLRRARSPKFAILCYHRIGTEGVPLFSGLEPRIFEAQMQFIKRRYRIISLDQLCDEMERPTAEGLAIAVTFDDGYRDLYTYALPILQKHRIPATIFLPVTSIETGEVPWYDRVFLALKVLPQDHFDIVLDRPRSFPLISRETRLQAATTIIEHLRTLSEQSRRQYCESLEREVTLPREELCDRMLTWEQVRAMCRAGIGFGSHTMTHPAVSRLTEKQLESELRQSKQMLEERIGAPVRHFAFPFGKPADCGTAAQAVLAECGYRSAATTVEGICTPGDELFGLHRLQIGEERSLAMFAFKLNQQFLLAADGDSIPVSPAASSPRDRKRN